MSAVQIREVRQGDLESVLALYAAIEDSSADVLTLEEAQAVWAQFARYPRYRLGVACDPAQHGAVVGTYALLAMHNLAHRGHALGHR